MNNVATADFDDEPGSIEDAEGRIVELLASLNDIRCQLDTDDGFDPEWRVRAKWKRTHLENEVIRLRHWIKVRRRELGLGGGTIPTRPDLVADLLHVVQTHVRRDGLEPIERLRICTLLQAGNAFLTKHDVSNA